MPIWKRNFSSRFLRLSELPRCRERPQRMIREIQVATGLDASLSFLLRREGVLANGLPVSPLYYFLQ